MRSLIFVLVLALVGCDSSPAPQPVKVEAKEEMPDKDGCIVKTSSQLTNQRNVSPILNLVKEKEYFGNRGECTVKFDIVIDGTTYHLEETETGLEQLESLCYYARERARKNLLLDLGGEFKSEAVVACRKED